MAVGGGRGDAPKKVSHWSVLFFENRSKGMGLSQCLLEGPENGTLGPLGQPNGRVRLGSRGRGILPPLVEGGSRRVFRIVAQILGGLPSKGIERLLGPSRLCTIAGCREERAQADANGGGFEVDPALRLGCAGTGAGREARGSTESPVGRRSGRSVLLRGGYDVLSARNRPSLALYRWCGGVAELAGDQGERRFLTASSKVSQSTSGRRRGRQGEQSPRDVVTGENRCYSSALCAQGRTVRCERLRRGCARERSSRGRLTGGMARVFGGDLLCGVSEQGDDGLQREGLNEGKRPVRWVRAGASAARTGQLVGAVQKFRGRDSKK